MTNALDYDDGAPALHILYAKMARTISWLWRLPGAVSLRALTCRLRGVTRPGGPIVLQERPARLRNEEAVPLTVISANLWHDWPQHRRQQERLEQFARLVEAEAVDIALLQEVSRQRDLHADTWLAARLGMAYAYARANGDRDAIRFEEGIAVFSRFPLQNVALHHLGSGSAPFVRRLALAARVKTPFGALDVFSVHLGLLPWQNAKQVRRLLSWVAARTDHSLPAIIGGDFNAHEDTRQVAQAQRHWLDLFRQYHPRLDGTTHELRCPLGIPLIRRRLDYLFLARNGHNWALLEARHLGAPERSHSDHRAVLARLGPGD